MGYKIRRYTLSGVETSASKRLPDQPSRVWADHQEAQHK